MSPKSEEGHSGYKYCLLLSMVTQLGIYIFFCQRHKQMFQDKFNTSCWYHSKSLENHKPHIHHFVYMVDKEDISTFSSYYCITPLQDKQDKSFSPYHNDFYLGRYNIHDS